MAFFVFVSAAKPPHILKREEGRGGERFRHFITRGGGRWSKRSFGANDGELRPATPDEVFRMRRGAAPVEAWERLPQPRACRGGVLIGDTVHEADTQEVRAAATEFARGWGGLSGTGVGKFVRRAVAVAVRVRVAADKAAEAQAKKDAQAAEAQAKKDADKAAARARDSEIEAMSNGQRSLARAVDAAMPKAANQEEARRFWKKALEVTAEDELWDDVPALFGSDGRSTPRRVGSLVRDAFDPRELLVAPIASGGCFVVAAGLERVESLAIEDLTHSIKNWGGQCRWRVTFEHGHLCVVIVIKS